MYLLKRRRSGAPVQRLIENYPIIFLSSKAQEHPSPIYSAHVTGAYGDHGTAPSTTPLHIPKQLERGRVLMEGWPRHHVGLVEGALMVRFSSPNPDSIKQEAQRFREMGLVGSKHFSVKMPEGGRDGYVSIHRKGLKHAAWLSVRGEGEQRELAAEFVKYILQRAEEAGKEVLQKSQKDHR